MHQAISKDLHYVMQLVDQYSLELGHPPFDVDRKYLEDYFRFALARSDHIVLLEPDKGFIFGLVNNYPWNPRLLGFVHVIFVMPEFRGTGLCVKLIQEYEKWAKINGAEFCTLSSISGINDKALKFNLQVLGYKESGFEFSKEI